MAEDIKSALHDASPSWNGFNYQGIVGLYVCLTLILQKLEEVELDSVELKHFLEQYSIEYEWIEDFAIKKGDTYISLHQVKHKAGTAFSEHISAVVTILNRKLNILSETDFTKYICLEIDYSNCNSSEERNDLKLQEIQSKMQLIRDAGYIDDENKLVESWKYVKTEVNGVDKDKLSKLLSDFESFTNRTFKNSKVYFHTAENVSRPQKTIDKYDGIPDKHKNKTKNLFSLSSLDIYLGFDYQNDYKLVLSDDDLSNQIITIIGNILQKTLPGENFCIEDIKLYMASLSQVIDQHIVSRHDDIRNNNNLGQGFDESRANIKFERFFSLLTELKQNQDANYWECFCSMCFEESFNAEISRLEARVRS